LPDDVSVSKAKFDRQPLDLMRVSDMLAAIENLRADLRAQEEEMGEFEMRNLCLKRC
jgi:hypothetical protein